MAFTPQMSVAFLLDAADRRRGDIQNAAQSDGGGQIVARSEGVEKALWTATIDRPAQVEAMLLSKDAVFMAGPDDRFAPEGSGFLHIHDLADGRRRSALALPVPPVHDGLAATSGLVVVVLRDGSVMGLASP